MVRENPTWGEERVADELALKLGIFVSPRTVRAYWPKGTNRGGPSRVSSQRWSTFVRNHAKAIVACDFLVSVTAGFRVLYVFVAMEMAAAVLCTSMSQPIRRQRGLCSSSVKRFPVTIVINF